MNITRSQWFAIINLVLSSLMTATAFLTQVFGSGTAQLIVGGLGLINTIVGGIGVILTGQGQQLREVAALPGVERISINAGANQTVAQAATDSAQPKIGATTPEVRKTILETAKGV